MPIEGLPPVSNYPILAPVSVWMHRLVAPLSAPLLSKDGAMEVVDRIKLIIGVALLAIVVFVMRYRSASPRPPSGPVTDLQSPPSTTLGGPSAGASSVDKELAGSISAAALAINNQFEALFSDLKQLHNNGLEKALQEFHQRFDRYKEQNNFTTFFKMVDHIEMNLRFLKELRENLFLAPIRMNDKGIIPQPPDGNCLFHSLLAGLVLLKEVLIQRGSWREETLNHAILRDKVVVWMRNNLETDRELQGYLDRAIGDYIEVREGQYKAQKETLESLKKMGEETSIASASLQSASEELEQLKSKDQQAKYHWYLDKVGQPTFFASVAEMYAFSKLYGNVSIHVWRELNGRYTNNFDAPLNESDLTINLAYNLSGDHFNIYVPTA